MKLWQIFLFIIMATLVSGFNATSENFKLVQAQSATLSSTEASANFQTEQYAPTQFTLNQSSASLDACHGYFCLINLLTPSINATPTPGGGGGGGAGAVCDEGYVLVRVKNQLVCLPVMTLQEFLRGENLFVIVMISIILVLFVLSERRRRKKKLKYPRRYLR